MTEKALNDVLRNLRVANQHLEIAKTYSEVGLHDHNVTIKIHKHKLVLLELYNELDIQYREHHYQKKHRR